MKTIYSGLVAFLILCWAHTSYSQNSSPISGELESDHSIRSSMVGNPPGDCNLRKNITSDHFTNPCSVYGFATVIPSVFSEPCDADEECSAPPLSCPARAGIYASTRWPFGCLMVQIQDYSHAHYFAPFLLASFNAIVRFMVLNDVVDQSTVSTSQSRFVGGECCSA
jgi:hypothetical protein